MTDQVTTTDLANAWAEHAQRIDRAALQPGATLPSDRAAAEPRDYHLRWKRGQYAGRTLATTPIAHLRKLLPRMTSRRWRAAIRATIEYREQLGHQG